MRVKLYFKDVGGDAVPYLWNDGTGVNHQERESQRIANLDDMEIARMNCSNRTRTITIVEGRQAALSIAYLGQHEDSGRSIMTHIGHDTWAVGMLLKDGSYDDGIPAVTDLRAYGQPVLIEADEDLLEELDLTVVSAVADPDVLEISPQAEMEPSFG